MPSTHKTFKSPPKLGLRRISRVYVVLQFSAFDEDVFLAFFSSFCAKVLFKLPEDALPCNFTYVCRGLTVKELEVSYHTMETL